MQPEVMYPLKTLAVVALASWILGIALIVVAAVVWILKAK